MDLDSPLDLLLLDGVPGAPMMAGPTEADAAAVRSRLGALRAPGGRPGRRAARRRADLSHRPALA